MHVYLTVEWNNFSRYFNGIKYVQLYKTFSFLNKEQTNVLYIYMYLGERLKCTPIVRIWVGTAISNYLFRRNKVMVRMNQRYAKFVLDNNFEYRMKVNNFWFVICPIKITNLDCEIKLEFTLNEWKFLRITNNMLRLNRNENFWNWFKKEVADFKEINLNFIIRYVRLCISSIDDRNIIRLTFQLFE